MLYYKEKAPAKAVLLVEPARSVSLGFRYDRHQGLVVFAFELHNTVRDCEQSVVSATTDVGARVKLVATLAYENVSRYHGLTTKALDA